jgi:hypothetical protein
MEARRPTADEQAGIQWWNSLTEAERAEALKAAGWRSGGAWTPSAADAWAVQKMRSGLERATTQRYLVIINGNGDPPYVFDNETKTKIMSYPTVGDAEHQAKLLNSFVRPGLETHRHL